jgi:hypothetical protein
MAGLVKYIIAAVSYQLPAAGKTCQVVIAESWKLEAGS